jgi:hypothetical protein
VLSTASAPIVEYVLDLTTIAITLVELPYVIESASFTDIWIYTKGTIRRKGTREVFYVFVSSKIAE